MSKRVASSSLNNFKITGEIDELSPPIKNGLVTHMNFEGGINYEKTLKNTKVLQIGRSGLNSNIDVLRNYGCTITKKLFSDTASVVTAIKQLTDDEILTYDMIYITFTAWGIPSEVFNIIDHIINDLGVSVLSDGNDTTTNLYIQEYTSFANNLGKDIVFKDCGIKFESFKRRENTDNKYYITKVIPTAKVIATIADKYIMAFMVEKKSSYIHIQEYCFDSTEMKPVCEFLISRSYGRIKMSPDIRYNNDGAILMNAENIWDESKLVKQTNTCIVYSDILPNLPTGINTDYRVYKFTPTTTLGYYKIGDTSTKYPAGTQFYFGAWCLIDSSCDVTDRVKLVGEDNTKGGVFASLEKKGEWQYLSFNVTSTGNGFTFLLYPSHGTGNWSTGNIYFINPTLVATFRKNVEFCKGIYTGKSIKVNGTNTKDFTIIIKHKVLDKGLTTPLTAANFRYINLYDANTSKKIFFNEYKDGAGNSNPWIGHDEYVTNTEPYWHWHLGTNISVDKNENDCIVICKEGDKIYFNAIHGGVVYKRYQTYTVDELKNFKLKEIEFISESFKVLTDVAIYDIAIPIDTISPYLLSTNPLSINIDGNINNKTIIEGLMGDKDVSYFPLDISSDDYNGTVTSVVDNNVLYSDNMLTISNQEFPNLHSMSYLAKAGGTSSITINGDVVTCFIAAGSPLYYGIRLSNAVGQTVELVPGERYTVEFEYTSDYEIPLVYDINNSVEGSTTNDNWNNASYDSRYNTSTAFTTVPKKWKKFKVSYTLNANTVFKYCYDVVGIRTANYPEDVSFSLRNIVFRRHVRDKMDLPFIKRGINRSYVKFNLHQSIGLDWSGDWTIMYHKRVHFSNSTGDTNSIELTGYNIDSLGCNGNTVGNNYVYWGRFNNVPELVLKANTSVRKALGSINDLLNGWHVVVIRKQGTNLIYRFIPEKGTTLELTATLTVTTANAFITQYNYDLLLGGWDNNVSGCYSYRDLVVAKKALNDTEINKYTKTFFKSNIDYLQINNEIIENEAL